MPNKVRNITCDFQNRKASVKNYQNVHGWKWVSAGGQDSLIAYSLRQVEVGVLKRFSVFPSSSLTDFSFVKALQ
jgi:hypothetical protein